MEAIDNYMANWEDKGSDPRRPDAHVATLEAVGRKNADIEYILDNKGVPEQEVHLGHRRRRLGLRYRFRRHRPRHGAEPRREPAGSGYRGVLNTGGQASKSTPHLRCGKVCRRR